MSVTTNTAVLTTLPPPTINSLGPSQRSRLLRSTRKLENLLGTTPQLVESDLLLHSSLLSHSPAPPSSHGSFQSVSSGPNEVAGKHGKRRSVHLPRPLVLRVNNVPNIKVEQPSDAASTTSPLTQTLMLPTPGIVPPSPLSPLFATEDESMSPMEVPQEKVRRKRMAKLTRTLGENIPTEFILPHDHARLSRHQKSPSEPSPRSLWPDWQREEAEESVANVNNATLTSFPPPTINALGPSERSRLVKSSRKLETLLGATPQVVEPSLLLHEKSKSQHLRVFPPIESPTSSTGSAESHGSSETTAAQNEVAGKHSKRKSVHIPPPLMLRVNVVPTLTKTIVKTERSLDAAPAQILTLPPPGLVTPSPLSPLFTPMSPMEVPQENIRRKRMAKLTRTLGEIVPTELIVPNDRAKHQRSPSEPSPRSLWPDWRREENQGATRLCPQIASALNKDSAGIPVSRSKPAVLRKHRRRPASVGIEAFHIFSSNMPPGTPSSPERPSSASSSSSDYVTAEEDNDDDMIGLGWQGEWNIKDAQERAMALRNLRTR